MSPWSRVVRFNGVGLLGVGVQLAALWFLIEVVHLHPLVAASAAVGLAVVHNFIWHWRWTWRDRTENGASTAAFVRFAAGNGLLSLVGNLGVMATLVSATHMNPLVANAMAIGVSGLLNFWLGDQFVFRRSRPPCS